MCLNVGESSSNKNALVDSSEVCVFILDDIGQQNNTYHVLRSRFYCGVRNMQEAVVVVDHDLGEDG